MASSLALWYIVFAAFVVFAHAEVTLEDFSGVWRGYFRNAITAILTPQGPGLACINTLPPECVAQLALTEDTYIFNGTTLVLEVRESTGITTQEQAIERFPVCAKHGVYPIQTNVTIPPSRIISYDSEAERIYYIDPRRPNEINCFPLRYRIGKQGPYIDIEHSVRYEGSPANVVALGISYFCDFTPGRCSVEVDDAGKLSFIFDNAFNMTCIAGGCLNAIEASEHSASLAPKESPVDV